jgi:mono/diheme cytochrome c family protein
MSRTWGRLIAVGALALVTVLAATACGGGDDEAAPETAPAVTEVATEPVATSSEPAATTSQPAETAEAGGDAAAGEAIFASAGCGSCHTLEAAGSSGGVGPNLDDAKPSFDLVVERVTNGAGAMPSFSDSLDEQQIKDVAAYVVQSTQG